ncbi:MAG: hypothetical protein J5642_00530 [Bacteroidales bacterium]|nr:hypothetical protein [Bacteroidales bacterium]
MTTDTSTANINATCKSEICKAIRSALQSPVSVPSINKTSELFDPIENPLELFVNQFNEAGGKCVVFDMDAARLKSDNHYAFDMQKKIYEYLKMELEFGKCNTILNTSSHLVQPLQYFQIPFVDSIPAHNPVDAVIVYAEFLIARSASIVFSQRNGMMLYPSIKNLAKNIFVLSSSNCIIPDLHTFVDLTMESKQEENRPEQVDFQFDMTEIIRPTKVNEEEYTAADPKITLILIHEV